ncbi:response regulator [Paenibacillus glycanilyticus]|uniref:response regulator n=1 Tax=Paenibacillus glycanilyticus TaxID=126569 RepID=UPI0019104535|nr:response regulator [Paenibacillus glycanilyticus]
MITVILADDEPIIIKGLKKLIPWDEKGIEITGEAWTGRGLLEEIEQKQPSLVITDISMPDGSGIDVLKEISRRGLRTKVIFISAYQEFSYAKDALALGAVDYLVKPIEKDLLLTAVDKALSVLREETEEMKYKTKLADYEHKNKKSQLEEVFDRLIEGDIRKEDAFEKLDALEAGYLQPQFTALLLEPELPTGDPRWGEHEMRLLLFAIGNMAEEIVKRNTSSVLLRKGDRLCVVVNHTLQVNVLELACEIHSSVEGYLKIKLSIGVGIAAWELEGIKASYRTASDALGQVFFAEKDVVAYSQEKPETTVSEKELGDARQGTLLALLSKDRNRIDSALTVLLEQIEHYSLSNRERAVMACYGTIMEWSEGLEEVGIALDAGESELTYHLNVMHSFRRYGELKNYIREIATLLYKRLDAGGGKEAQQLLIIKDYIENHYMENITLEGAASKIFMNPYYFSSFFKKHTQMNFKQYLTEVRMKQALKLLLQTDLMVYEIAEQVGYNNARQFSDMFKKFYGKLPQEYKAHSGSKN